MSRIKQDLNVTFQLKGIELLKSSINIPGNPEHFSNTFNFNIKLETKAISHEKLLFVVVTVDVKGEGQNLILGSLAASCIYHVPALEEVAQIDKDGKVAVVQPFADIINSISISTVRGIMFSTFKGTFLHNAFLPIIDPKAFKPEVDEKV